MSTDFIKSIAQLIGYGLILIFSYYSIKTYFKNKKVPIEIKIAYGILAAGIIYLIYDWIKFYIETGI